MKAARARGVPVMAKAESCEQVWCSSDYSVGVERERSSSRRNLRRSRSSRSRLVTRLCSCARRAGTSPRIVFCDRLCPVPARPRGTLSRNVLPRPPAVGFSQSLAALIALLPVSLATARWPLPDRLRKPTSSRFREGRPRRTTGSFREVGCVGPRAVSVSPVEECIVLTINLVADGRRPTPAPGLLPDRSSRPPDLRDVRPRPPLRVRGRDAHVWVGPLQLAVLV